MKIGLICPDFFTGHLNPMTTLGGELASRGHSVCVIGDGLAREYAVRESLEHLPLGGADPLVLELAGQLQRLAGSGNFGSMLVTGNVLGLAIKIQRKYLPDVIAAHSIDALVIDQFSPAACLVAEQINLPYAVACNALSAYWEPSMPPPPLPWGFRDDWFGHLRNRVAAWLLPKFYYWLSDQRRTKVDPLMLVFEHDYGLAQVAQQPEFFDFPRTTFPPNFHYTAPWHHAARDDQTSSFPWDWLDGRPLIYASMGTLQNRLGPVFRRILDAVSDLDMQVVLSKGGGDVPIGGVVPDNVIVVDRAPQLRLLEKASLAITHAGLNTALECLAHGVPMLCLPVTNDQPGVAKRVEWLGAGRVVPVARVTTARLKAELAELLSQPKYAKSACDCRQILSDISGPALAADVIEKAFTSVDRHAKPPSSEAV